MKATAQGPANIAFIKYWAKVNPKTRIPQNNSISMCLSDLYTICTVEFDARHRQDEIIFLGEEKVTRHELDRIKKALDQIRKFTKVKMSAKVVTKNNFPKATGIASSASGFSALVLAALSSLGVNLKEPDLSMICREMSGTACRSIPDGFVEWEKGTGPKDSYARQIFPVNHFKICDVVVIVTKKMKKISSTDGHMLADTSPFFIKRLENLPRKIKAIKKAIKKRDFSVFGKITEMEALEMHTICMTSSPSIIYWEPTTIGVLKNILKWREMGKIESYFTIDAGPSVHVICREKDSDKLAEELKSIDSVERIVVNKPARGAHLISQHLF